ncbi:hypothetical protein CFAM422_006799 [Trichoderma lentiforme]|uniref:Myb-like domain-containing protein n=1 Tax=Trichoderma lentiforme TaxID=1567552 RepID=A0A9P5CBM3_9HYPO|nr:hypothetical protein CFAM422_006799 [Trichoderma lentiforme]
MHDSLACEKEASPLLDKPANLTGQNGISSPISESIDSNLQDEFDDSSVPIWVQRALAAGRTPLPCSRPPIKTHRMHIAGFGRIIRESSYDSQETVLEQSPVPEEKQTAKGKVRSPTSNGNPEAKNSDAWSKKQDARAFVTMEPVIRHRVQRKKWKANEIENLIRMREDKMSWVLIAEAFSNRTVASVRQTFFKYRPQCHDTVLGEE